MYKKISDLALHELYSDNKNRHLDSLFELQPKLTFIEKRRHALLKSDKIFYFKEHLKSVAYKNFKIVTNVEHVKSIKFLSNGSSFSVSYPNVLLCEYSFDIIKDQAYPIDIYSEYSLIYDADADFEIEYDVLYCETLCLDNYHFIFNDWKDLQYVSNYTGVNFFECEFDHSVRKILIQSNNSVTEINIVLDDNYEVAEFTEIKKNLYVREFEHCINFSKINTCVLSASCIKDTTITIFYEFVNCVELYNGCLTLKYFR